MMAFGCRSAFKFAPPQKYHIKMLFEIDERRMLFACDLIHVQLSVELVHYGYHESFRLFLGVVFIRSDADVRAIRALIILVGYLAALIHPLPRRNGCVFSSPSRKSKTGYIFDPRRAHGRACAAAGIEGLTLHGLRRSFGTLSEWVEAPVGVVAQIMGHKPSAIAEKHYRRRPLDLLRLWHVKIEGWILEQTNIPQPAGDDELGLRVAQ
jgi:hypothetical protein